MNENYEKIVNLIRSISVFHDKELEIDRDTNLMEDLGFDSIRYIQLIADLESEFGFEASEEDLQIENLQTVGDFVLLVESKK
ncbi:MAG: phosphopantetheine-binding protein [Clostridia bacterium]|nr:phosphopantetheine-binding protein [Clostridia bacterium]